MKFYALKEWQKIEQDRFAKDLFFTGNNYRAQRYFGSRHLGGNTWQFRLWAPHAEWVSLVGDFCGWDITAVPLIKTDSRGVWEGTAKSLHTYDAYKYAIGTPAGDTVYKADPYANHFALRPDTASKLYDLAGYCWHDSRWLNHRAKKNYSNSPLNIYELHLGSWLQYADGNFYSYPAMAEKLLPYVKKMGYTHVELMPITEFPFDRSWGYQVTGYFAPTSRYGTPHDFMAFVDRCHQEGIGVLMDWVPAHFPKDAAGLYEFDGGICYEYQDPLMREHPDWGTRVFDYGRPEVISFLISSACHWFEHYHIDGLRVDAVASMLYRNYGRKDGEWSANKYGDHGNLEAVELLRRLNGEIHASFPGALVIAEESTAWPHVTGDQNGGLGFDFKWSMGWMNDSLQYISKPPLFRHGMQDMLTFAMTYIYSEQFILPLSHDEVVHGKCSLLSKMPGTYEEKFQNLKAFYGYMMAHPGKKLLFMGGEFGQFIEWDEAQSLDWLLLEYLPHRQLQAYVQALNHFYKTHPAFWAQDSGWEGFEWISLDDTKNCILAFLRKCQTEKILVIVHFSEYDLIDYNLGLPEAGTLALRLCSDEARFGGEDRYKKRPAVSKKPYHGFKNSAKLHIPPFSATYYNYKTEDERSKS
jgi:1,4-alpha-glucan branching enzyme